MKIAFITSGLLPLPATKGGAIETLLDILCKENEISEELCLEVISIYDKETKKKNRKIRNTNYIYITNIFNYFFRIINKFLKTNFPINKVYQTLACNYVNKRKYDYVIVENYPELAGKIQKHKVIPFIHSDVFNTDDKNSKLYLDKAYKVLVVSNFIKNRILEIDSTRGNDIIVFKNCIDFPTMSKKEYLKYRKENREKYRINKNDIVFVILGRISEEKGVLEFVKAFYQANLKNAKLLIIGGVWYNCNKSTPYLEEIKQMCDEKTIFTGYISHDHLPYILTAGDIGVMVSIGNEAAGLSAIEFLRSRMQTIISNKGGIKEYVPSKSYIVNYEIKDVFINDLTKIIVNTSFPTDTEREKNYEFSLKFTTKEYYQEFIKTIKKFEKDGSR